MAHDVARHRSTFAHPARETALEDVHVSVPIPHERPGRGDPRLWTPLVDDHDGVLVTNAQAAHDHRELWRGDDVTRVVEEHRAYVESYRARDVALCERRRGTRPRRMP